MSAAISGWHGLETNAPRQFHHLFQTGAQAFWIVRIQCARRPNSAFYWRRAGRYVGYPMGYWCEFAPAYGFHQGFVHPTPHTHGCIRLKGEAAAKFYALVRIGTPVNIANTQPEDETIGPKVQRGRSILGRLILQPLL